MNWLNWHLQFCTQWALRSQHLHEVTSTTGRDIGYLPMQFPKQHSYRRLDTFLVERFVICRILQKSCRVYVATLVSLCELWNLKNAKNDHRSIEKESIFDNCVLSETRYVSYSPLSRRETTLLGVLNTTVEHQNFKTLFTILWCEFSI